MFEREGWLPERRIRWNARGGRRCLTRRSERRSLCVPGTTVLWNTLNPRDAGLPDRRERELVKDRVALGVPAGLPRLQTIHQYLFQDVHGRVGKIRAVDIAKDRHRFQFRSHIQTGMANAPADRRGALSPGVVTRELRGAGRGDHWRSEPCSSPPGRKRENTASVSEPARGAGRAWARSDEAGAGSATFADHAFSGLHSHRHQLLSPLSPRPRSVPWFPRWGDKGRAAPRPGSLPP